MARGRAPVVGTNIGTHKTAAVGLVDGPKLLPELASLTKKSLAIGNSVRTLERLGLAGRDPDGRIHLTKLGQTYAKLEPDSPRDRAFILDRLLTSNEFLEIWREVFDESQEADARSVSHAFERVYQQALRTAEWYATFQIEFSRYAGLITRTEVRGIYRPTTILLERLNRLPKRRHGSDVRIGPSRPIDSATRDRLTGLVLDAGRLLLMKDPESVKQRVSDWVDKTKVLSRDTPDPVLGPVLAGIGTLVAEAPEARQTELVSQFYRLLDGVLRGVQPSP